MVSSQVKESDASLILPIIACYGAGRLWQKGGSALGGIGAYSRFLGYAESLDSGTSEARLP